MANEKIYRIVVNQILEKLRDGIIPWEKPWICQSEPRNLTTGNQYNGINSFVLGFLYDYENPYWVTFGQIKTLGGHLKKGSKSVPIIYYRHIYFKNRKKIREKDFNEMTKEEKKEIDVIPLARYYNVFNIEQTEGISHKRLDELKTNNIQMDPIKEAEKIKQKIGDMVTVNYKGNRAYYVPSEDSINIPEIGQYKSIEGFYTTLFHEGAHSTGHKSRLNRDLSSFNGSKVGYSFEELIAEITSAFLARKSGIENTANNHAAYCQAWLKKLENDPGMIIKASSKAQKASDYILNQG